MLITRLGLLKSTSVSCLQACFWGLEVSSHAIHDIISGILSTNLYQQHYTDVCAVLNDEDELCTTHGYGFWNTKNELITWNAWPKSDISRMEIQFRNSVFPAMVADLKVFYSECNQKVWHSNFQLGYYFIDISRLNVTRNHLNAGICRITLLTKAFLLTNQFSPNFEISMMLSKNVIDLANLNVEPSNTLTPVVESTMDGINWDHNSKQSIPDGPVTELILDQKTMILAN